jgi:protease II
LHRTAPLAPFPGQANGTPMPTLLYGYGSYGICIEPEFSGKL